MLPAPIPAAEDFQLPDVTRLAQMPSLPEWVALRIGSLKEISQRDQATGKWPMMTTLPANLILKAAERERITKHVQYLQALCAETPESSNARAREMLVTLTELMLVLPSATQNEVSAEAKGAAFLDVLEDVPVWAVRSAIRRWQKGQCGNDERGRLYDSNWCPAPAALRRVALVEFDRIRNRIAQLERLLAAKERVEQGEDNRLVMREKFAELLALLRTPPVGSNGSGEAVGS